MDRTSEDVLVIGGGIAGLTVALGLAKEGWHPWLIEKEDRLGGHAAAYVCKAVEGECQRCGACLVDLALKEHASEARIKTLVNAAIERITPSGSGHLAVLETPDGLVEQPFTAVVLCHGFAPFDPRSRTNLGYGRVPNIMTGHELEAMLKVTGRVLRPSDGAVPRQMAFVQCVGSRNARLGHPYCSQVCCGYALRMARQIKNRLPETDLTCFYMDIQTYGKDFPDVWPGLGGEIRFIREIPGDYFSLEGDRVGVLVETGDAVEELSFDLLVLSVGMAPSPDQDRFCEWLNAPVAAEGFLRSDPDSGVFVAGSAAGPMSIIDSIAHARAAVRDVAGFLEGRK